MTKVLNNGHPMTPGMFTPIVGHRMTLKSPTNDQQVVMVMIWSLNAPGKFVILPDIRCLNLLRWSCCLPLDDRRFVLCLVRDR